MPVGGPPDDPWLHPVALPSELVDWPRTERFALSARYQHYAVTRGEADYQRLTDQVAALLNDIALSTDRERALALAEEARVTLAAWPRAHFGYRQHDVRDIVGLLDASISRLRSGAPSNRFEVSLVAMTEPIEIEPIALMPSGREQLEQIVRVLRLTTSARDRVALLRSGLTLLADKRAPVAGADIGSIKRSFEDQLRDEERIDRRYAQFSQEVFESAARAAADARIADVQRALNQIPKGDDRLGRRRPEVVQALTGSVQAQLDRARQLRLLRDQWTVRQSLFREYERSVGRDVTQLADARPLLEAIRTSGRTSSRSPGETPHASERRRGAAAAAGDPRIPAVDARLDRRRLAVCRERGERPRAGGVVRQRRRRLAGVVCGSGCPDDAVARRAGNPRAPRATQAAVITPRATRLVRVEDLQALREAAIALALEGTPLDARDRLVVVPTRAAAVHLLRSLEDTLVSTGGAALLPDLITQGRSSTGLPPASRALGVEARLARRSLGEGATTEAARARC